MTKPATAASSSLRALNDPEQTFQNICRTCMSKNRESLRSIFDQIYKSLKICEMLNCTTPQLFIDSRDPLPKSICLACLEKLNIAYQFQEMCISSDNYMRNMLDSGVLEKKNVLQTKASTSKAAIFLDELPLQTEDLNLAGRMKVEITDEDLTTPATSKQNINMEQDPLLTQEFRRLQECIKIEMNEEEINDFDLVKSLDSQTKMNETAELLALQEEDMNDTTAGWSSGSNKRSKLPCAQCNENFDCSDTLKRHSLVHTQLDIACDICKRNFSTKYNLIRHKLTHDAKRYMCPECPRGFKRSEKLAAHVKKQHKLEIDKVFNCDTCQKEFQKANLLKQHLRTHPENQKFKCSLCEKTFGFNTQLIEHMNKHEGLKPFVCAFCKKAFYQKSALTAHQRIHNGEKPFLCPYCGKSFQNASNMRQHVLRHSGVKRYQCPECPSKFYCLVDVTRHKSIHRKDKPHVCDICGSSFARADVLNKHKLIHSGERPYECDECSMSFKMICQMKRHKKTHTGERPYKCKLCERAFADGGDLSKHLRRHVGGKIYKCEQCSESFKYRIELREHEQNHFKQQQQILLAKKGLNLEKTES